MRRATLHVVAVEVHCPYCREPQPEPQFGSMMWEPVVVVRLAGPRQCLDCGKAYEVDPVGTPLRGSPKTEAQFASAQSADALQSSDSLSEVPRDGAQQ